MEFIFNSPLHVSGRAGDSEYDLLSQNNTSTSFSDQVRSQRTQQRVDYLTSLASHHLDYSQTKDYRERAFELLHARDQAVLSSVKALTVSLEVDTEASISPWSNRLTQAPRSTAPKSKAARPILSSSPAPPSTPTSPSEISSIDSPRFTSGKRDIDHIGMEADEQSNKRLRSAQNQDRSSIALDASSPSPSFTPSDPLSATSTAANFDSPGFPNLAVTQSSKHTSTFVFGPFW